MASCGADRPTGFATPAAIVVCLALATVTSAGLLTATMRLRASRADYDKTRAQYALEGAQVSAAIMLETQTALPHAWTVGSPVGPIALRAEPEEAKLAASAAGGALPNSVFRALSVEDPEALRTRLRTLAHALPSAMHLEAQDAAPAWRACARRLVSPWGRAGVLRYTAPTGLGDSAALAPVGSTWRVQAVLDGWEDERTVLLTGSPTPLLRERAFRRLSKGAVRCDDLLNASIRLTPATP